MNEAKRKKLEAQGWKVGTVQEFLDLTPEEAAYIEVKLALAKALRERRTQKNMTQEELAQRISSSQSRIAKMEKGDPSVSLDLLIKGLFALDATQQDIGQVLLHEREPAPA